MNFNLFQTAVIQQFAHMKGQPLFRVDISKEELWNTYLSSFPEGSNPIFRERTVHDCQCCKSFIRKMGGVVSIVGGRQVSIWDAADIEEPNSV